MAHRLVLEAPGQGPAADLSRTHPHLALEGMPLGQHLLLRAQGPAAGKLLGELRRAPGVVHAAREQGAVSLVLRDARAEAALLRRAEHAGALPLPPLRWQDGRIRLELLAMAVGPQAVQRMFPGAAIVAKRAVSEAEVARRLRALSGPWPDLRPRQAEALLAALRMGYYDEPRRCTTGEVAQSMGIARSTFEEHLKRAESRLLRSVAPLVRLRLEEQREPNAEALQVFARFSDALGLYVHMALRGERVTRVRLAKAPPAAQHGKRHPYLARILHHIATGEDDLRDIPVDLEVSPFEREVLEAMRRIPPGEVRTYGELARALRKPGAARAVGNACAKNPVPLVVPCHRVVPSDGTLGNYSAEGGARTKARLLAKEGWEPG
jgi:O-6-methylguanine DNA methyltransferase